MSRLNFVSPDEIRARFSSAMSDMYRKEVPQYGVLLDLVADVNASVLKANPTLRDELDRQGELERISLERHGAIRLGKAEELATMRRLFAIMGMFPVGYYDLSVAGMPVHSTAFRPISDESLTFNPFRIFTSLLRIDLIADADLRATVTAILEKRQIFTPGALKLIEQCEREGGLNSEGADLFVAEALETFRWHARAAVDAETYGRLANAHRLIADIVSFRGPHINHLTPRTLDIDRVQKEMPERGIVPKDVIEGPPTRTCPVLLRQTSFKALEEPIYFVSQGENEAPGTHTARFGEIEQRGIALTRKGRALYDQLLASVREHEGAGSTAKDYGARLKEAFRAFPDTWEGLRREGLGFFRYSLAADVVPTREMIEMSANELVDKGYAVATPIIYEDFLPVSAAGIFQSNLGGQEQKSYGAHANHEMFVAALGSEVIDEFTLYEEAEGRSIKSLRSTFQSPAVVL
ncbi:VOC family protein [Acetobacter sp.]|uniref:2-oxoadipate dioxygenase/decarboxylase HglS n=1 Tax=Acetobacter sp. TaxID=440 RepID=UPI0039E805C5